MPDFAIAAAIFITLLLIVDYATTLIIFISYFDLLFRLLMPFLLHYFAAATLIICHACRCLLFRLRFHFRHYFSSSSSHFSLFSLRCFRQIIFILIFSDIIAAITSLSTLFSPLLLRRF